MLNTAEKTVLDFTKWFGGVMENNPKLQKDLSNFKMSNLLAPQSPDISYLNNFGGVVKQAFKDSGGWEQMRAAGTSEFGKEFVKGFKGLDKMNLASAGIGVASRAVGPADYGTGLDKALGYVKHIPGVGQTLGVAADALKLVSTAAGSTSGKNADVSKVMSQTAQTGYAGLMNQQIENRARDQGKKSTLFSNIFGGKKSLSTKANNARTKKQNELNASAHLISQASDKARGANEMNTLGRTYDYHNRMSGNNNIRTLVAKNGAKLPISMNVIPEGALHARKHNLDIEDITNKGIPVISHSGGGEVKQHAEIEVNEIVLRKEATDKLESFERLYRETEDKKEKDLTAVEAGKYFAYELFENTNDNTGLIEKV